MIPNYFSRIRDFKRQGKRSTAFLPKSPSGSEEQSRTGSKRRRSDQKSRDIRLLVSRFDNTRPQSPYGCVHAYDKYGWKIWENQIPENDQKNTAPILPSNTVNLGSGNQIIAYAGQKAVYGVGCSSGKTKWHWNVPDGKGVETLFQLGDYVILGLSEGGRTKRDLRTGQYIHHTVESSVHALKISDGKELWNMSETGETDFGKATLLGACNDYSLVLFGDKNDYDVSISTLKNSSGKILKSKKIQSKTVHQANLDIQDIACSNDQIAYIEKKRIPNPSGSGNDGRTFDYEYAIKLVNSSGNSYEVHSDGSAPDCDSRLQLNALALDDAGRTLFCSESEHGLKQGTNWLSAYAVSLKGDRFRLKKKWRVETEKSSLVRAERLGYNAASKKLILETFYSDPKWHSPRPLKTLCYDSQSGEKIWEYDNQWHKIKPVKSRKGTSTSIADNIVYVLDGANTVSGLSLDSGERTFSTSSKLRDKTNYSYGKELGYSLGDFACGTCAIKTNRGAKR